MNEGDDRIRPSYLKLVPQPSEGSIPPNSDKLISNDEAAPPPIDLDNLVSSDEDRAPDPIKLDVTGTLPNSGLSLPSIDDIKRLLRRWHFRGF